MHMLVFLCPFHHRLTVFNGLFLKYAAAELYLLYHLLIWDDNLLN